MSGLTVDRRAYRLELVRGAAVARLRTDAGELTLPLVASFDTQDGRDETVSVAEPRPLGDGRFEIERASSRWERATIALSCTDESVDVVASVRGVGVLEDVHLLAGRTPSGYVAAGHSFATLFSPAPEDPARILRDARERVALGAVGDSRPGRGHWFFTPPPLYVALAADDGPWLTVGIAAPVERLTFPQLVYEGHDRAFALRLEYEGHTHVDGSFDAPAVVLAPAADPLDGLRRHRSDLAARGFAPAAEAREVPAWWREPIFCGWGAQCAVAAERGRLASAEATQANYDDFLGHLGDRGVVPGTIVLDDKWQAEYGSNEPDRAKWPDLRAWIAARHAGGQHVLLWWKAWDVEGVPADACVRAHDGTPVALDPTSPEARALLEESVTRLLAPNGLDADGLKIDFTARTPSGASLAARGTAWGIALLHELLAVVYDAAKRAKPDALVITHTPHPAFVDVTDMVRLNDLLRLEDAGPRPDVVPQMRYRADVVRAACPDVLIDTDDWCAPNLQQWRAYRDVKTLFGVPSLYYARSLDLTSEELEQRDYDALREQWERWRAAAR